MVIPLKYNIKSLCNRRISTILILFGISLVIMIFISMVAMAQSMKQAIVQTGCEDNVIIKNKSTASIEYGFLPEEVLPIAKYLRGIRKNSQGIPLVSAELYNIKFIKYGAEEKVIWLRIRGITNRAFEVHSQVKMIAGRKLHRGQVIIGKDLLVKFGEESLLGKTIQVGKQEHAIAGVFESGGSTYEGEIWMDKEDMRLDFDMKGISLIIIKLESTSLKKSFIQEVNENPRLPMADAIGEIEYYSSLTGSATFVLVMGIVIAVLMSLGAIFGGMNIMYMSIAARTREIGTLRVLGFTPFHILAALIIESLFIALCGGIIGGILSIGVHGYSLELFDIAFSITITPMVVFWGCIVSLFIGFFGGLLPGRFAAKMHIVEALRHV